MLRVSHRYFICDMFRMSFHIPTFANHPHLCCLGRRLSIYRCLKVKSKSDVSSTRNQKVPKHSYRKTLNLPKTSFPLSMKDGAAAKRELEIQKTCNFGDLYNWQRNQGRQKEFILHDGPPYANGDPHVGHALNKILKDVTTRYKILTGHRVHYVPGWDCHGMPIEQKALAKIRSSHIDMEPLDIRNKARNFASKTIQYQRAAFQRWGVLADWNKGCYFTFDKEYVADEMDLFYKMYTEGLIYQDYMPVFWSPSSSYTFAKARTTGDTYLISSNFLDRFSQIVGELEVVGKVYGNELLGTTYRHPLYEDMECPFLSGDHVTVDKGTGLVHTAPAHGPEDFQVAVKHGLSIECHVDMGGRYTKEVGSQLYGKSVLEDATQSVIELIGENILHRENFEHSYPYDWRSKTPVILRASSQWFVNTSKIKERAKQCLRDVTIHPLSSEQGMVSQLDRRTYWCISRQRVWGVPVPVFYKESDGTPLITRASVDHLKNLVRKHGTDFWWTLTTDELLPQCTIEESGFNPNDRFIRGNDILDIWFDSGSSWAAVLQGKQADVYMEGLDQFGGWFQSSLLTSVAAQDKPPYKALVVHGFAVDEDGRKMSKSVGNVVDPQIIINGGKDQPAYGADVLRWWAAFSSFEVNVNIGPSILHSCQEQVFRVRKALRFLMGNLHDFNPEKGVVQYDLLLPNDQYMLHLLKQFSEQVTQAYEDYNFSKVVKYIEKFVSIDVSGFHCHLTKDRLYCSVGTSVERRSGQTVQHLVLNGLLLAIAPILPHLAEEAFQACQPNGIPVTDSLLKLNWKLGESEWNNPKLADVFIMCFSLRDSFYTEIGSDNPVQFDVTVHSDSALLNKLKVLQGSQTSSTSQLAELLQCSHVSLSSQILGPVPMNARSVEGGYTFTCEDGRQENMQYQLVIQPAEKSLCERCRKYTASQSGDVCERCRENLSEGWDI